MVAVSPNIESAGAARQGADASTLAGAPIEPETFEELRWPVGIRLQCLLNRGSKGEIVTSTLIGYAVNEYLIVRTPLANGLPMQLEVGESLRVRAFSGMYVGEFKTEIDRVFRSPFYLHLLYPTQVRVQKLRSAPRVKVDLPAKITTASGESLEARVLDVSINGAQASVTGLGAQKGQMLTLHFELDGAEAGGGTSLLAVNARVAAAKGLSESAGTETADADGAQSLGLVFDSLDSSDGLRIANFVYLKLLAGV